MKKIDIFPWSRSFETGIKEIDEQHKSIVILINDLAYYFIEDKEYDIKKTFDKLIEYTEYHFETEEMILEKYIKSKKIIQLHKKGHSTFLPKIREIRKKYYETNSKEEILLFLIKWLAFHIIDEDKRLFFILNSMTEKELSSLEISDDLIKDKSSKYDKQALETIYFIWETTLRIKAVKKLKGINKKLKELIDNNSFKFTSNKI